MVNTLEAQTVSKGTKGRFGFSSINMGVLWFVLALAGGIAVFWLGFRSLANAWLAPEYSHGPLIPVLSFYLFLRQLKTAPPIVGPVRDRWPGVVILILTLGIAMVGNLARIPDIVTYAMILWIYALLLIGFGWRYGRQFWPPVVHLVFMLPLPAFIYWKLSIQLQFFASEIGVWLVQLVGIPVYLDGNIIDLGVYKLHVAEACSGLRYLFPIMSFSYIFAVLYQGPTWHKALLLLAAAPIAILMNSVRIGVIGVMVDSYGIESAEGFMHFFEGWVIFLSCIALLFGLARLLQWLARDRRPFHVALDLDTSGLAPQMARVFNIRAWAPLIAGALLTLGVGAAWHATPTQDVVEVARKPLVLFPRDLGGWQAGLSRKLDTEVERILGADDYLNTAFTRPDSNAPVDLLVTYYHKQTEGQGIHSPEVCIPAGGWEMSSISQVEVTLETAPGQTMAVPVNRAVIQKGLDMQLVYYWFEQRGRRLTSDYYAKAVTVLDGVMLGRTDGGLVRLITPILPGGGGEEAAEARLEGFLGELLPVLPEFVPDQADEL